MSQPPSFAPGVFYMFAFLEALCNNADRVIEALSNQNANANNENQDLAIQDNDVAQADVDENVEQQFDDESNFIDVERVSVDGDKIAPGNDNDLEVNRKAEQAALDANLHKEIVATIREMIGSAVRRRWLDGEIAELDMIRMFKLADDEKWSLKHAEQVALDYIDRNSNLVNRSLLSSRRPSPKRSRIETETDTEDDDTEAHSDADDFLDSPKLGGDDDIFDNPRYENDSFNSSGVDAGTANVMTKEDEKAELVGVARKRTGSQDEDDEQPKKRASI